MTISAKAMPARPLADRRWWVATPGELMKLRTTSAATGGVYTMFEAVAEPRNGVPMHVHANEDEHFLVLEGALHMANGDARLDVPAGAAITVQKGVPHAWANLGDTPVRFLIIFSPGRIEEMFMKIAASGGDVAVNAAASDQFGTTVVGPVLAPELYSFVSPRS
jgi:mannose-6-phosphate isomerase-like protein (cupin superfamily)